MPILQVLLNDAGEVIGTARPDANRSGQGPDRATIVARPGQRVVEVTVPDHVARMDPNALHATIRKEHLKEHLKARPKTRSKQRRKKDG
jgi:hypothetical protein